MTLEEVPVAQTLEYLGIRYRVEKGRDAWALCPLHEENTPSFHIDLRSGLWFCMGCQQGGRLEEFVTLIVHDPLASIAVIHRARGLVSVEPRAFSEASEDRSLVPVDPLVGWRRFQKVDWMNLPLDHPVAAYLVVKRGFQRDTLRAFDVRFTEWGEYPVAFQIHDGSSLVGYVRRRIDGGEPKYRYNEGFRGADHVAYYSVDDSASCLLVEGVLDLMKAAQHGAKRVAALLGWRLNQQKVRVLEALGVKRVVCATDNTPSGEAGWGLVQAVHGWKSVRFKFPEYRKDVGELSQHEFLAGIP